MRQALAPALVSVACAAAALGVRLAVIDPQAEHRRTIRLDQDVLQSPGHEVLRVASLQHAPAWADLLWLQLVQELGKPLERMEARYDRIERWAKIAVDLDQKYFTVYWAAAIHLIVYARRAKSADDLLLKGHSHLPERWELLFLLGYNSYFLHGNAARASEFWQKAARLPGAPRFIPSLAARSRFHAGDEKGAEELLETMMQFLEGPHLEDAQIRLKLIKGEYRLRKYDAACLKFKEQQGRVPKDGAELAAAGLVDEPPIDFFEDPITIDENCRARSKQQFVREDEATERVGSQSPEKGEKEIPPTPDLEQETP